MQNNGTKFKQVCISYIKVRRGSADITIDEAEKSSIRTYLRKKKLSFIAMFQSKSRKETSHGDESHNLEEEEALRCLDDIIETENSTGNSITISTGHEVESSTTKDIRTIEAANPKRYHVKGVQEKLKYDTIKGFDSFMLY